MPNARTTPHTRRWQFGLRLLLLGMLLVAALTAWQPGSAPLMVRVRQPR